MADNIELDAGSGGATVAADDVGGVHYQVIKIDVGGDGAAAPLGNSNPIPVSDAGGTLTVDNAGLTELAAAINGSSQMDVNIAASNATVAVSNSGLTELAAAINASSQMDVNIAASVAIAVTDNGGNLSIDDGGNTITVDGTVAVTHAALTELGSALVAEDVAHQSGDLGLMALAVRQDTQSDFAADGDYVPLSIDADGGLRVSIVAGAGSGGTAVADDADFVDGTTSLTPIGGVYESSPSTVTDGDIGMVGITVNRELKVAISSGGVSGKVDDAAFTAASDEGVLLMGVNTADSVDSGDAGAIAMTTARAMHVAVQNTVTVGSHAVTNAGTFAVQVDGSALTALQLIDDPVATLGTTTYTETTTKGMIVGAVRRDADTTLVDTTNEIGPLQMDANGRLKVEAFSGETLPVSLASVPSHAVTNAGTFAVQVDGSSLTALQLIDDPVFADDAGYTLSTSKVSVIGGIAVETDGTDPTTVSAEADAAALRTDRQRTLLVNQTNPRFWHVSADYASAQTNTSVKASPGASLSLYITDLVLSNGATAGNITLLDGSGGTVLFELYPAINGGVSVSLRNPIKLTAATALCITSTTVTTHSIFVSGYIAP